MPTICRMLQLSPDDAASLAADPASLPNHVTRANKYGDVYRYWHAIEYLLAQHRPGSAAARWLAMGMPVSPASADIPSARLLSTDQVRELHADLRDVQPEDLVEHYDAAALDAAQIYPATWQEWEETFDPLGQVLEHYSFLQMGTERFVKSGAALLLYFEVLPEGAV